MGIAELDTLIRDARNQLQSDKWGLLPLPTRTKLWTALGPERRALDGSGNPKGAAITAGMRRRFRLAEACTQRVFPVWEQEVKTRDPLDMLDAAQDYLRQEIDWNAALDIEQEFLGGLQHAHQLKDKTYVASAGCAAVGALDVVLTDGLPFYPQSSDWDVDYEEWDPAFSGSVAWAHGSPWVAGYDPDRGREWWFRFLDQVIPSYESVSDRASTRSL